MMRKMYLNGHHQRLGIERGDCLMSERRPRSSSQCWNDGEASTQMRTNCSIKMMSDQHVAMVAW